MIKLVVARFSDGVQATLGKNGLLLLLEDWKFILDG